MSAASPIVAECLQLWSPGDVAIRASLWGADAGIKTDRGLMTRPRQGGSKSDECIRVTSTIDSIVIGSSCKPTQMTIRMKVPGLTSSVVNKYVHVYGV
jgi:hypothetical protein